MVSQREQVEGEIGGQVLEQLALYAEDELKLIPEYACKFDRCSKFAYNICLPRLLKSAWKLWEHPNFGKTVVFNDDHPDDTPESN